MSRLRQLALCFVVAALAFVLGALAASHPDIGSAGRTAADLVSEKIWQPARDFARRVDVALLDAPEAQANVSVRIALAPSGPNDGRTLAHAEPPPMSQARIMPQSDPGFPALEPVIIAPDLGVAAPEESQAVTPPPRLAQDTAPPRPDTALTPEQARARQHLLASLTPEMRARFGLFLFVSKAEKGPLAQHMYIFAKEQGALKLVHDWAASTGREKNETDPGGRRTVTTTPGGLYQLDPGRMYVRYHSTTWDQDMPYAMFFNWQQDGQQTGLAIHAATGADIDRLGQRASAGCVHLSPENARTLFNLIQDQYRGAVPRFAIDGNDTMSNKGRFARTPDGNLKLASGYRVLIDIENYGGTAADKVAALF